MPQKLPVHNKLVCAFDNEGDIISGISFRGVKSQQCRNVVVCECAGSCKAGALAWKAWPRRVTCRRRLPASNIQAVSRSDGQLS